MAEEQQQAPGLSLADLQNVVVFIDAAVQRGAIRGEELTAVAALRERFTTFIQSNQQEQAADVDTSEAPAEEEAASE
jgi:hypothetical protein